MKEIGNVPMHMMRGVMQEPGDQGEFKPRSAEQKLDGERGEMAGDLGREKGMGTAPQRLESQPPLGSKHRATVAGTQ